MFNVKYEKSDPISANKIEEFETKRSISLPSDYTKLLLFNNEFILADDNYGAILDKKGNEITGLEGPILSLQDFELVNFDLSEDMKEYYNFTNEDYYIIALLHFNCYLLIGCNQENLNKIFLSVPQEDTIEFLSDSFEVFINDTIKIIE